MKRRDLKMDFLKGLLVLGMVGCHVFQFFVPLNLHPVADRLTWYVNAVTFSGFVFTFGYTNTLAYYRKDFSSVWVKMLRNSWRLLLAFYGSGIAFRVFVTNQPMTFKMIKPILLLADMPGWSEFIISFAYFMVIGMVGFGLFQSLLKKPKWLLVISGLLLMTTFIPYDLITFNPLGVLIGTRNFAVFPVLQYMPYYLLGMYFSEVNVGMDWKFGLGATLMTLSGFIYMAMNAWQLPGRFPPTIFWILLPGLPIYLYYCMGILVTDRWEMGHLINGFGRYSMYYLLMSNVLIFSLSGTKAFYPLTPMWGIIVTGLLLFTLKTLLGFVQPTDSIKKVSQEKLPQTDMIRSYEL